ncbi:hypothetical protein LPJ61_004020 [Coemansia biformis]|uniref:Protein kinase domain-containing protein n=1 Tax=Coemansia biformis TaxID=1286918 RepID=A0A9W7YBH2_9FUNG|nr:hypothetical protein LPJ61_004020 [Coemansia biformis]
MAAADNALAADSVGISPELTVTCSVDTHDSSDMQAAAALLLPASLGKQAGSPGRATSLAAPRLTGGATLVTAPSGDGGDSAAPAPTLLPTQPARDGGPAGDVAAGGGGSGGHAVDGTLALSIRPAGWTQAALGPSIRRLGAGTGGRVDLHFCKTTNKVVAIKTLLIKGEPVLGQLSRRVLEELGIAMNARHRNVVRTHEVVVEPDRRCYVVMEACATDLLTLLLGQPKDAHVPSDVLSGYFVQLVRGVHYLHGIGIAHRDLKLDNVCVTDDGVVKIVDFGCATLFRRRAHTQSPPPPQQQRRRAARPRAAPYTVPRQPQPQQLGGPADQPPCQYIETMSTGVCGSDPYMAPELFAGGAYSAAKVDVWALGIILFAMRHVQFPWGAAEEARDGRFRAFVRAPGAFFDTWLADDAGWAPARVNFFNITRRKCAGPAAGPSPRRLLSKVLAVSPASRTDVGGILRDPWFASLGST